MFDLVPGIQFTDTVSVGSLVLGIMLAVSAVYSVIRGVRWRVAAEVSSAAADELRKALLDTKQIAADREALLAERLQESQAALRESQAIVARLESLPDMARVISLVDAHEQRAQERHEATALVLRAIADSLNTNKEMV